MTSITQLNSLNDWYDELTCGCLELPAFGDYLDTLNIANEIQYQRDGEDIDPDVEDALLIRYLGGMARRIQRCWFNREELPMACPCPESP